MTTRSRSTELRKWDRRVLAWSLGIAAVLHAAVFMLWPALRVELLAPSDTEIESVGEVDATPLYVEVTFGPPDILEDDGTVALDSPDRSLETNHVLPLPPACVPRPELSGPRPHGRVRLRVPASGRAAVLGLVDGTGDACGDAVIVAVAEALWYRWLPNERFPAPLELIQPITLIDVGS